MTIHLPITKCAKCLVNVGESIGKQMLSHACTISHSQSNSCCSFFHSSKFRQRLATVTICRTFSCSSTNFQIEGRCLISNLSRPRKNSPTLTMRNSISSMGQQMTCLGLSSQRRHMSLRLSAPNPERVSKISWSLRPSNWLQAGASAGLMFGLFVCFSSSDPVNAEAAKRLKTEDDEDECDSSSASSSHGKKVYTDYSITGIPGDGRCLFRSVVHGACIRSGKPSPKESLQKELADELRASVADEFVRRREETEWFIEGDFDTYVARIRQPHVWGGEPELFISSHVLRMPITVYMHEEDSGGLITIAEYGQEYGKENPIRVLYHGYGHYDAVQIPGKKSGKSRL